MNTTELKALAESILSTVVQLEDAQGEIRALRATEAGLLDRLAQVEAEHEALKKAISDAEPVAAQHRFRHPQKTMPDWSVWQPCHVTHRAEWELDAQGYETEYRNLYTLNGIKKP